MYIDLHCHTKKVKSGEAASRDVSKDLFLEKVKNADVKIVAITNHNHFDLDQYDELRKAAEGVCQVWPGVELDVMGSSDKKWHLVVVTDPENVKKFDDALKRLLGDADAENFVTEIHKVLREFGEMRLLLMPHFHKSPSISEEDLAALNQIAGESVVILNEVADIRTLGVLTNHNYSVIIGSDVSDWSDYEKCTFAELRLPVDSFQQLFMLAKRDAKVVNTLLDKTEKRLVTVKPHKDVAESLNIYSEVNVIFGPKGTGKTEVIKSLEGHLDSMGLKCSHYYGSEKDAEFTKLLSVKDVEKDVTKVGSKTSDDAFKRVLSWSDATPVSISKYMQWGETRDASTNKKRLKITNSTYFGTVDGSSYEDTKGDFDELKLAIEYFEGIPVEAYTSKEFADEFGNLIKILRASVLQKLKVDLIELESAKLADFTIRTIKSIADRNSSTVSKPSSTGFYDFATNRLQLKKDVDVIIDNIDPRHTFEERCYLGSLDDKGEIYITTKYRMLDPKNKTRSDEFKRKWTNLISIEKCLRDVTKKYHTLAVTDHVNELKGKLKDADVGSTQEFLGVAKLITRETGEYSPSNGERAILMMQYATADKSSDAYLFDEPELGMGNAYIDHDIRPMLSSLGKSGKIVVIATQNANIAVRTLPYMSIFRDHDNGQFKTYIGNPFVNKLINIVDKKDHKSWKDESMKVLEGGPEAFYERRDIYESRKS